MMNSAGNSLFTSHKIQKGVDVSAGKTVHVPKRHYKMLMDKAFEADPQAYIRYKHMIAQHESKDGILKDTLFVRTRDDLDEET